MNAAAQPVTRHPSSPVDLWVIVDHYRRRLELHEDADSDGKLPTFNMAKVPRSLITSVGRAIHHYGLHNTRPAPGRAPIADMTRLVEYDVTTNPDPVAVYETTDDEPRGRRTLSEEEVLSALLLHSLNEFDHNPARLMFGALRCKTYEIDLSTAQQSIFDKVLEDFTFTLSDRMSRPKRRNFRCARRVQAKCAAVAKDLGIDATALAQVMILDSLRKVDGVAADAAAEMAAICADFNSALNTYAGALACLFDPAWLGCELPAEARLLAQRAKAALQPPTSKPRGKGKRQ